MRSCGNRGGSWPGRRSGRSVACGNGRMPGHRRHEAAGRCPDRPVLRIVVTRVVQTRRVLAGGAALDRGVVRMSGTFRTTHGRRSRGPAAGGLVMRSGVVKVGRARASIGRALRHPPGGVWMSPVTRAAPDAACLATRSSVARSPGTAESLTMQSIDPLPDPVIRSATLPIRNGVGRDDCRTSFSRLWCQRDCPALLQGRRALD